MNAPSRTEQGRAFPLALQLLILLAVCAFVYWFRLGDGGFFGTEAHRAVPAYEMLDDAANRTPGVDHWLVPRMFEQPYLRKPPGMPWAIAGMSAVLGETVFAARAVSALSCTIMAFLAFGFARRWFGPRAALCAGLAQALMPVLWETGRAAEIEPLNNLGTQIAALLLIDAIMFASTRPARVLSAMIASFGVVWFALAKGPASVPVIVGVVAAACIVVRSWRPLVGVLWFTLAAAGVVIAGLGWIIADAAAAEPIAPVTQSPGAFLFEPGMIVGVLTLPFVAFASMLPASFALFFPWGPDARAESNGPGLTPERYRLARALAFAWLIAIGLFMAFGVRNPRYTLPAACLLPPLAGVYLSGLGAWLTPKRGRIARALVLGRPTLLAGVLIVGALGYMYTVEANRRATSGSPTGIAIGEALADWIGEHPGPIVLIADGVVEARPEVVLEIERTLAQRGLEARVLWIPRLDLKGRDITVETRFITLLRTDAEGGERGLETIDDRDVESLSLAPGADGWDFHKYRADLYLVEPNRSQIDRGAGAESP